MSSLPPAPQSQSSGASSNQQQTPTIEALHRDIALANQYRIELIKILLTITAALFAFTVTFRPSLIRIEHGWAMWAGWGGLALSMIGGLFHMLGWDHYYKSYRDFDWKNKNNPLARQDGKIARKRIDCWRKNAMYIQFGGFIVGVACIGIFAGTNIDNALKPTQSNETNEQKQAISRVLSPNTIPTTPSHVPSVIPQRGIPK